MRRRAFLGGAGAAAGVVGIGGSASADGAWSSTGDDDHDCGVASGEPSQGAVTIWTRIPASARVSAGLAPGSRRGSLAVRWFVVSDEDAPAAGSAAEGTATGPGGRRLRRSGIAVTDASRDWTVKVRVEGLDPGGRYVYGFLLEGGEWRSARGNARTLPPEDSDPGRMTFAYVSCQYFGTGFYTVYRALARDAAVDFCIHLGDSIYEATGGNDRIVRVRPDLDGEALDIDGYRARYRRTLSDPWYREVRRRFTWICLPDDHEIYNDYHGTDPSRAERRRGALTAYFEYTPIDDALFPRLHRCFRMGRLATLFALDERQHRDGPACPGGGPLKRRCDAALAPGRSMLGADQRAWLGLGLASSGTRWNVLLSEVLMMPQRFIDRPGDVERAPLEGLLAHSPLLDARERGGDAYLTLDSWDGYPAERASLMEELASAGKGNTLVWTGDIHNMYSGFLRSGRTPVGFEMSTGSVTSFGVGDVFPFGTARLLEGHVLRSNDHYVAVNLRKHMYVRCTLDAWHASFETVCAHSVRRSDAGASVEDLVRVGHGSLGVTVDRA